MRSFFFFFNDTATTEIYTLSLHDALPICGNMCSFRWSCTASITSEISTVNEGCMTGPCGSWIDRKSTRLNSSHGYISYAVFCLKKKKNNRSVVGQAVHHTNRRLMTYSSSR